MFFLFLEQVFYAEGTCESGSVLERKSGVENCSENGIGLEKERFLSTIPLDCFIIFVKQRKHFSALEVKIFII